MVCRSQTGLHSVIPDDSCKSLQARCFGEPGGLPRKNMQLPMSNRTNHKTGNRKEPKTSVIDKNEMSGGVRREKTCGGIWDRDDGMVLFPEFPCGKSFPKGFGPNECSYSREEFYEKKQDWKDLFRKKEDPQDEEKEEKNTVIVRYYDSARQILREKMSTGEWDCTSFFEEAAWMLELVKELRQRVQVPSKASSHWARRNANDDTGRLLRIEIVLTKWILAYHKIHGKTTEVDRGEQDLHQAVGCLEAHCENNSLVLYDPSNIVPNTFSRKALQRTEDSEDSGSSEDSSSSSDDSDESRSTKAKPASSQKKRQGKSSRKTHVSMDRSYDILCTKRSISKKNKEYDDSLVVTQFHASYSNVQRDTLGTGGGSGSAETAKGNLVIRLDPTLSQKSTIALVDIAATSFQRLHKLFIEGLTSNGKHVEREQVTSDGKHKFDLVVASNHDDFATAVYGKQKTKKEEHCTRKDDNAGVPRVEETKGGKSPGTATTNKKKDIDHEAKNNQKRGASDMETAGSKQQVEDANAKSRKRRRRDRPKKKCCGCSRLVTYDVTCNKCNKPCHPGCIEELDDDAGNGTCRVCYKKTLKAESTCCELGDDCQNKGTDLTEVIACNGCHKKIHDKNGCAFPICSKKGKAKMTILKYCETCYPATE